MNKLNESKTSILNKLSCDNVNDFKKDSILFSELLHDMTVRDITEDEREDI
jgi:hypothetical protein